VVEVTGESLTIGDLIRIKGRTTDYTQFVTSMQIEHVPVQTANAGDVIGLEVKDRVREHDTVYKVSRSA
jgi:putative protease